MSINILVVNDDGINGIGLKPLAKALAPLGKVTVVVPERERSAVSQAITLHKPIRVNSLGRSTYIMNGTPADCVRFGVISLLKERVDLVVSGINRGANLGADTLYSGTVGAAKEGCMYGISSMAVSLVETGKKNYKAAAQCSHRIARILLRNPLPKNVCLNVNVPDLPAGKIRGVAVTRLGERIYGKELASRVDPRGQTYYWLAGQTLGGVNAPGSDMGAIQSGRVSVTPLRLDATDPETMALLNKWKWRSANR